MDLRNLGLTGAFTSGLLTGTGAETVYDTTAVINFCIKNKAYQKAAVTDGTTPTTDQDSAAITLTANYARVVVWCLNSSGTVSVKAGDMVAWDGVAFQKAPPFPAIDTDTYAPFAYSLLKGGSTLSGTWTFGSSNWNATGMTATHTNVIGGLPPRPQTS